MQFRVVASCDLSKFPSIAAERITEIGFIYNIQMKYIIGIDEVGRGALAGPVTVTALAMPINLKLKTKLTLRDSKKLSTLAREEWVKHIESVGEIIFSIKSVSPKIIDKINISVAANLAAHNAVSAVLKKLGAVAHKIYLDGGLYIKSKAHQGEFFVRAETVIKGDEKIMAVSLASIVAKVHRDKYMFKLGRAHPEYGFSAHKGYGTKMHRKAIRKHGRSGVHRLTFTKKYNNIKP